MTRRASPLPGLNNTERKRANLEQLTASPRLGAFRWKASDTPASWKLPAGRSASLVVMKSTRTGTRDPTQDAHLTVWECSQHLVRALEHGGEGGAAMLLRKIGPRHADATRDLAYCLYDIAANKRKDAAEATAWNGLIAVWPELTQQAAAIRETRDDLQGVLDL